MNILLINPPSISGKMIRDGRCMQRQEAWGTSWAPLTLAQIAAVLRDEDFTVRLRDCSNEDMTFEGLRRTLEEFRPSLVVVTTATSSIKGDCSVAGLAQEVDPGIRTVLLGLHPTALPEETFALEEALEFIARAEPEYTIRDLAVALRDDSPLDQVKGLIYRDGDGVIVRNEPRPFIQDLDALPLPAWDLIDVKKYRLPITRRPFLLITTSRGCPHPCLFCAANTYYGHKIRIRSAARIVEDILQARDRHGIRDFLFWAENSTADREQLYELSRLLIEKAPDVRWVCNGRVDDVDKDLLQAMKQAGCWMIGYGIESGTQAVLDRMKKQVSVSDIERAVRLTKRAGIQVTGHVIIGHPGETEADIAETSRFLKRIQPDYIQVYCCVPFPGSPLYDEARQAGWLTTNDWSRYEQHQSVLQTDDLSPDRVMWWREKLVRSFYLHPRRILQAAGRIRSPQEALFLFSFAIRYFSIWATSRIENTQP